MGREIERDRDREKKCVYLKMHLVEIERDTERQTDMHTEGERDCVCLKMHYER